MILIDLYRAFDTINHDIILQKLGIISFSSQTVKLFLYSLSNHKFTVNLQNPFSGISGISYSLPQGSIVGPLLFLIMMIYRWQLNANNFYMSMIHA